jgi:hypothetical protein
MRSMTSEHRASLSPSVSTNRTTHRIHDPPASHQLTANITLWSIPSSSGQPHWESINVAMKREKGIKSKTWLSNINTNTIGGFYEFDSIENAKAHAVGYLAKAAEKIGGSLTVRLFDGDVVEAANRGMNSPFYDAEDASAKGREAA